MFAKLFFIEHYTNKTNMLIYKKCLKNVLKKSTKIFFYLFLSPKLLVLSFEIKI